MTRFHPFVAGVAIALAIQLAVPAQAADPKPLSSPAAIDAMSDSELDERTAFLVQRLDEGQRWAQVYQYGFTAGWTLGIGIGVAQAATTSKNDTRVNGIVTASKAAIGVGRLVFSPAPGRLGSEDIATLPAGSHAQRVTKLTAAETRMSSAVAYAERRTDWLPHLTSLGLNLAGAGITAGLGDWKDAVIGGVVGIAAGEALIWLRPSRAIVDAEDYHNRFSGSLPKQPGVTWNIVPTGRGAFVQVRY